MELKDGTGEFVDKTDNLDTQVSDEIDSMISSVSGSDVETVSFVSDKNTNVKGVQFVIKTDEIKTSEIVNVPVVETEEINFWQKLLRLFGLY